MVWNTRYRQGFDDEEFRLRGRWPVGRLRARTATLAVAESSAPSSREEISNGPPRPTPSMPLPR